MDEANNDPMQSFKSAPYLKLIFIFFIQVLNGLAAVKQERNPLLDLLDLDLGGGAASSATSSIPTTTTNLNALDDILGLNLGNSLSAAPTPTIAPSYNLLDGLGGGGIMSGSGSVVPIIAQNGGSGASGLDSLLTGVDSLSFGGGTTGSLAPVTAYEKHGLRILFTFPGPFNKTATTIILLAHNLTQQPIQNFVFQVSVIKYPYGYLTDRVPYGKTFFECNVGTMLLVCIMHMILLRDIQFTHVQCSKVQL
jgi:hypothetical protein